MLIIISGNFHTKIKLEMLKMVVNEWIDINKIELLIENSKNNLSQTKMLILENSKRNSLIVIIDKEMKWNEIGKFIHFLYHIIYCYCHSY